MTVWQIGILCITAPAIGLAIFSALLMFNGAQEEKRRAAEWWADFEAKQAAFEIARQSKREARAARERYEG